MAMRQLLPHRILSPFLSKQPQPSPRKGISSQFLPSIYSSCGGKFSKQGFQTLVEPNEQAINDAQRHETHNLMDGSNSVSVISSPIGSESSGISYSAISKLKTSPRHDLAMMFTCKVCETRNMKTMCRDSYEKGVVVARCGGCANLHLIADHLGWFGEPGSIEQLLAARGEEVKKGSVDTLNLTLDDLAGKN